MELRPRASSTAATRLWKIVKIAFVMIRKGLTSKRNFSNDMIDRARDRKLMRESPGSLGFSHYDHSRKMSWVEFNGYDYEFSCSESPDPVFVHSAKNKSRRFPCMRLPKVIEDFGEDEAGYPEHTFNIPIERRSPPFSPSSEGVSNYSSDGEGDGKHGQVDRKAEEFIMRFHDQLRKQAVH